MTTKKKKDVLHSMKQLLDNQEEIRKIITTKKKKVSMKEDLMQKLEDHRNILKPEEYVELLALIEEASESNGDIIHVIGQRLGYTKCLLLHNHDFTDVTIVYF
jgi:hypothetical protein